LPLSSILSAKRQVSEKRKSRSEPERLAANRQSRHVLQRRQRSVSGKALEAAPVESVGVIMTSDIKTGDSVPSRRVLLQGGVWAGAAVLAGLASGPAAAFGPAPGQNWAEWANANTPKKSTQTDADYRVAGLGGRRCATCRNFMPPHGCAVVQGACGPDGVCKLYYGEQRRLVP
jgi:hypothetical protein